MDKNTSHLAGEFLVAGELSRRGYPVSITMGNAKAVDIYVQTGESDERGGKRTIRIDVKASRTRSWPVGIVSEDIYYILVYLGTTIDTTKNRPPEYFIAQGNEIKGLVKTYGQMRDISYKALSSQGFREAWNRLPPP